MNKKVTSTSLKSLANNVSSLLKDGYNFIDNNTNPIGEMMGNKYIYSIILFKEI